MSDLIVGIDLGTTNSEVAAFTGGQVRVLGPRDVRMLPSCVGFSATGELLVGEAARHQQALYPERTVRSIKRKMGSEEKVREIKRGISVPSKLSEFFCKAYRRAARDSVSASKGAAPPSQSMTAAKRYSWVMRASN